MSVGLQPQLLNGALLIDKPAGVSSFGVIERVQWALRKRFEIKKSELPKFGHGGTLDPFATGLLIVFVGRGVKMSSYFLGSQKTYRAQVEFGKTTASGDLTNPVTETGGWIPHREDLPRLREVASEFTRTAYHQTPPMHSAIQVQGKRLYELAREGKTVERSARICQIERFEVLHHENTVAEIEVVCSAGTYIRTLAQDWAIRLGALGYLTALRRTGSGKTQIESAVPLDTVLLKIDQLTSWEDFSHLPGFITLEQLFDAYPRLMISAADRLAIQQGRLKTLSSSTLMLSGDSTIRTSLEPGEPGEPGASGEPSAPWACVFSEDKLVAMARPTPWGDWEIEKVLGY